jgi:hypothetical protein
MNRQISKQQIFGVPSIETTSRIEEVDKVSGLEAAHYRCGARMRELEARFETEASKIRAEFVQECQGILEQEAAE